MPKYIILSNVTDTYDTREEALAAVNRGAVAIGFGEETKIVLAQVEVVGLVEMKPALSDAPVPEKVFISFDEFQREQEARRINHANKLYGVASMGGLLGADAKLKN